MRIRSYRTVLPGMIYIILQCLTLNVSGEQTEVVFSKAETLLWLTDQLKNITRPVEFTYQFNRTGTFEPEFTDTVRFKVEAVKSDGMKSASVVFFSGDRNLDVPSVESTTVNPILKIYLQGDVYDMNRLTDSDRTSKGRWRYFQRRIKLALAESAVVEEAVIPFDGKEYEAYKVSFSPYVDDPKRRLFEHLANKKYSVIVSEKLPGYLYRIETVVPGASPSDPPLIREVLQLATVAENSSAPGL